MPNKRKRGSRKRKRYDKKALISVSSTQLDYIKMIGIDAGLPRTRVIREFLNKGIIAWRRNKSKEDLGLLVKKLEDRELYGGEHLPEDEGLGAEDLAILAEEIEKKDTESTV